MTERDLAARIEERIRGIRAGNAIGHGTLGRILDSALLRKIAAEAADEATRSRGENARPAERSHIDLDGGRQDERGQD